MTSTRRKRILSILMAMVMVLSLLPTAAFAVTVDNTYAPGEYTGEAKGYEDGIVTVTVTLSQQGSDVVISDIEADGSSQTPSVWNKAKVLLDTIKVNNGTTDVDTVSGATKSSNAIIRATEQALSKALSGFVGGTGTQTDPWQISSEAGLRYLQARVAAGESFAGQYIKLTADIALTEVWTPIGAAKTAPFSGTFDGGGHTISGLTITDNTLGYAGLFGYVGKGGCIKNVSLTNVNISISGATAAVYAGALAAFMENDGSGSTVSVIDSCSAQGAVSVDTSTAGKTAMVGGLIGMSNQYAAITNCGTDVAVTVNTGSGIATVGGLVGMVSVRPLVMNNYSLGNVSVPTGKASSNVGGMFGQLNGIAYNCYTSGSVTASADVTNVGGLAGKLATAYAASCYCAGETVFGDATGSYDSATVSTRTDLAGETFADLLHNALAPAALESMAAAVTGANITGCTDLSAMMARNGNAFQDWALTGGRVVLTGSLWTSGTIDNSIFASGSGTQTDPYLIQTEAQLRAFAGSLNDKIDYTGQYVRLANDITLTGGDWKPIGESDYLFNGTFDGAGHTISGMKLGSADAPYQMDKDHIYFGLFGVLGTNAVVRNVDLTNIAFYTSYAGSGFVGGIAGVTQGSTTDACAGPLIDSCSVSGTISHTGGKGNQFVAGLVGMQYKGAIINSSARMDLSGVVTSGDLAEVGGLVGLNNRGLVANCWSDSDIYGSGDRTGGNEGMAAVSNLIACNAGTLVNCWASGDVSTGEHSTYAGMVTGWVTGIGKSYSCWYDLDSHMTLKIKESDPQTVSPVESIGTKVASGVSDEDFTAFTGGLVDKMTGYNAAGYQSIVSGLNGSFAAFPADIALWGLEADALKTWICSDGVVTFGSTYEAVNYVQPECEKYKAPELVLRDGTWYGRDDGRTTVVKITVENNKVTEVTVLSGSDLGDAYEAAVKEAERKATYGDTTHYEAADPSRFAGGSGTRTDPYLIANEAQLRYIASAINEDVDWSGVWFKQTADIALTDGDWKPIGWSIKAEVDGAQATVAVYPFRGSYDGGGHTISGLTVGTESAPADQTTSGLFGMAAGEYATNEKPTGDEQVAELKNIHLRDVSIHVSTRYETYAGGLVGSAQNGVYIDNCSVTGEICVTAAESFARAGGLVSNFLRGAATSCWTDVDITAVAGTGHVYAGGLYGGDNRVTTVNSYALGDVTGSSENNNKVHIGGLTGQGGGIHVNCYAAGDVISRKTTSDVGGLNGRAAGICVEYNCYYNTEAVLKQGDTTVSPAVANGVAVSSATLENVVGKTAQELASQSFADLLNSNSSAVTMADIWAKVEKALDREDGLAQQNYYRGNALSSWVAANGVVTFGTVPSDDEDSSEIPVVAPTVTYHPVSVSQTGSGTVTVSPKSASVGSRVTITVTPGQGSTLTGLTVTDQSGNALPLTEKSGGQYTFRMPAGAVTVAAAFADGSPAMSFADVPTGSYCYDAVLWAVANGVTEGVGGGSFAPDLTCTRAQIVTFLWRAAGCPAPRTAKAPFSDVSEKDYYYQAVLWAVENGITTGTSATTFGPDGSCTRAQAVTLLCRAMGTASSAAVGFTDVDASAFYAGAVAWAVEKGITTGTGAATFSPDDSCTRGQIVTFLYRAYQGR